MREGGTAGRRAKQRTCFSPVCRIQLGLKEGLGNPGLEVRRRWYSRRPPSACRRARDKTVLCRRGSTPAASRPRPKSATCRSAAGRFEHRSRISPVSLGHIGNVAAVRREHGGCQRESCPGQRGRACDRRKAAMPRVPFVAVRRVVDGITAVGRQVVKVLFCSRLKDRLRAAKAVRGFLVNVIRPVGIRREYDLRSIRRPGCVGGIRGTRR